MTFMGAAEETLHIEVEKVEDTWRAAVFTFLTSGRHSITLRLVGRVDGVVRYSGHPFSSANMFTPMDPDPADAPRIAASLEKLRREIEADGWEETGRGSASWPFTFVRPAEMTDER